VEGEISEGQGGKEGERQGDKFFDLSKCRRERIKEARDVLSGSMPLRGWIGVLQKLPACREVI